jgi:hypothetical protein
MASNPTSPQKQSATAFWRSYFAKFRRRVGERELSETGPAPLSETPEQADGSEAALPFPDRRRKQVPRHRLLR